MAATPNEDSSTADQIDVTFTSDNDIEEIACEGGLSPREVATLAEMIEEDPARLQSPGDRATDLTTTHHVSRDDLTLDGDESDGGDRNWTPGERDADAETSSDQ
jgi:DNA-directed RNA polymerase sigma subunit (sigma70/sigma32)